MNNIKIGKDIVLTIDDDRFIRTMICDVLEEDGYTVVQAKNGKEGIEKFLEVAPDLILMDVEMPIMNGFEACQVIKEHPQGKHTPMLFVTSRADDDFVDKAFGIGADDYILKPIHTSVLRRRIRRMIDGKRNEDDIIRQNTLLLSLHRSSLELLRPKEIKEILQDILENAVASLNVSAGGIYLLDQESNVMRLAVAVGVDNGYLGSTVQLGEDVIGQVWEKKRIKVIADYLCWQSQGKSEDACWCNFKSAAVAPLKVAGVVLGTIAFFRTREKPSFGAEDISALEQYAALVALGVENSRLFQAVENEVEKLKRTQSQLIQKEKMAGIGQLAAGVAHEMNNPLGFVTSNFNMLGEYVKRLLDLIAAYREFVQGMSGDGDDEIKEAILQLRQLEKQKKLAFLLEDLQPLFSESKEGLARVGEIIKALRIFSRVDVANQYEDYDLNAGVETTLVVARNEIKYVADVSTDFQDIPTAKAIGGQINQVLLNLLVNGAQAIKAAQLADKGMIRVTTFADGDCIGCSITNNGPVIPKDIQNRIFEPFFTTKPIGEGTGLGLSISYDIIVNQHGGKISFVSTPDEGTTFTIKIPCIRPTNLA